MATRRFQSDMPRARHSDGYVRLVGKTRKKWEGNWYEYDGDKRRHRAKIIGLKTSKKTDWTVDPPLIQYKWEAEEHLRKLINDGISKSAPVEATFRWFWENRYRPMKEPTWERTTKASTCNVVERHILPKFGDIALKAMDKFSMQAHLNELSSKFSYSLVAKVRVFLKAVLAEAIEQDLISKNQARNLDIAATKPRGERFLTPAEVRLVLEELEGRDRLIFRILYLCALRPGEVFALRLKSVRGEYLFVRESATEGRVKDPKNRQSKNAVYMTASLQQEMSEYITESGISDPEALLFPSKRGTPMHAKNYIRDVLAPAAESAGVERFTHQMLRRTFGTLAQQKGTVKDVQGQMRHASAITTLDNYSKTIPEGQKLMVESLDLEIGGGKAAGMVQ